MTSSRVSGAIPICTVWPQLMCRRSASMPSPNTTPPSFAGHAILFVGGSKATGHPCTRTGPKGRFARLEHRSPDAASEMQRPRSPPTCELVAVDGPARLASCGIRLLSFCAEGGMRADGVGSEK